MVRTLVRPQAADRLSAAQARLAFLPDANHPAVREVFATELDRTVAEVAEHADRLWPADRRPSGPGLDAEGLGILLLCLVTGSNRLLRTNPSALPVTTLRRTPAGSAPAHALAALVCHPT